MRASGSVGANYIEANESLSKKDFLLRIKYAVRKLKKAGTGYSCLKPDLKQKFRNSA
jgi:hypothetical protein